MILTPNETITPVWKKLVLDSSLEQKLQKLCSTTGRGNRTVITKHPELGKKEYKTLLTRISHIHNVFDSNLDFPLH